MEKIELICDANPRERIEIIHDKYGLYIAIVDEDCAYHEIQLNKQSAGYLFDFINKIQLGAYKQG